MVAAIHPGWDIGGNANGGYLLALAARALAGATGHPDPVTVTGHYLSPGQPGSVRIATQVLKEGKRFATGTATMFSGARTVLAVLGTFGDLSQAEGPELIDGAPPRLPPPQQCVRIRPARSRPRSWARSICGCSRDAAFTTGHQSGHPLMRGWFRLPRDEPIDSLALLCAVDAFPPTAFNARLPVAWTPTVELTAHIRAAPAPGWLRCRFDPIRHRRLPRGGRRSLG